MAERKAWWEILRDQFASRGLLDPESERLQEAAQAAPAVQRQARGLLSLDPQAESDTVLEMGLGALPGVGQAMALRDLERARRAKDPGAAAMAASNFVPFGNILSRMRRRPVLDIDVYQGSPYKFEPTQDNPLGELDPSKIGSGYGRQAFGHGSYLAEMKEVAKDFRGKKPGGNIYTIDLPDKMLDEMLDWDVPLSAQSPSVRAKLEKAGITQNGILGTIEGGVENPTGEHIYRAIKEMWDEQADFPGLSDVDANSGSEAAARFLQSVGVQGTKFEDLGGRGRNFALFPGAEKKTKIKKRE